MGDSISKVLSTLITVVIAVGASAAIWVGANLLFNQVRDRWSRFLVIAMAACGVIGGVLISGNRLIDGSTNSDGGLAGFLAFFWFPLLAGAVLGITGFLLSSADDATRRLVIGVAGVGALGAITGLLLRDTVRPELSIVPLVAWTAAIAVVGAGISVLRKKPPVGGAMTGAAIGWVLGAFGAPDLGTGNAAWAVIASLVPAAIIGARIGLTRNPDLIGRNAIDKRSRAYIFVGPAVLFIFAMLVVPAVRTIYLSFLDRDSEKFVNFDNYQAIFKDKKSFDTSDFSNMFGSRLFWLAVILFVAFVLLGVRSKQRVGKVVELGSPSMFPLIGGLLFFAFALFTALRGTIINNLWWVVVVTLFSTSIGLAIAVLADGAKFEKVAKSIIFMPMAISLVGASVIWRFMYVARDTSKNQTGVMNALWTGLGNLSTGNSVWRIVVGLLVAVVFVLALVSVGRKLTRGEMGGAVVPAIIALLVGWFLVRYFAIIGTGVGGHRVNDEGRVVGAEAINFVQEGPFNNVWLMVVLIWIQSGFAMVILSAAIKAVPDEYLEAARVDGATDSQVFWRITLPQIAPTIGVVVTTLIVLVMKVYDIVKVMTNGNLGTEVLANNMFREAFSNQNRGLGAALAILLFVAVLPVMIFNIRKMQEEL